MRLIGSVPTEEAAERLAHRLSEQGIEAQVEEREGAWEIWIVDEDQLETGLFWLHRFTASPSDPLFEKPPEPPKQELPKKAVKPRSGRVTIITIAICAIIFLWGSFQWVSQPTPQGVLGAPIYQALMFDYPVALKIRTEIFEKYGKEELEKPETLPPEGKKLLQKAMRTPFWEGLYTLLIEKIRDGNEDDHAPLFTDIRKGEVWRLFTPCLLHGNLLHIFFNVIWLIVLGNQVERRLGGFRYIVLMLIVGILSNVSQYMMSGPLFFGLSGIVCGLFGFVWVRQRVAPWEGYLLSRTTIIFLSIYILGMAGLQVASFILEISGKPPIAPGIANTAHIVGVAIGALLGRFKLFRLKESR